MIALPGKSFFSPPKPPQIQPLPPLPDPNAAEIKRKRKESQQAAQRRKGFFSTIKTSGLGDTSEANVKRVTLLGQSRAA